MKSLTDVPRISEKEILRLCRAVGHLLGCESWTPRVGRTIEYADTLIKITMGRDNLCMEVTIFPPFTTAREGNPAIMVDEQGEVYRWHGEMFNATDYLKTRLQMYILNFGKFPEEGSRF